MNETMAEISLANSWGGIALLFLSFGYFFCGTLGFGNLLRRVMLKSQSRLEACGDSLLLGSLLLVTIAFALASLHLLGAIPRWLWWLTPLLGFSGLLRVGAESARVWKARWPFLALFGFIFLLRSITASLPLEHGDPLLYHLLGPRVWAQAGGFVMDGQFPNAILAASWECLYLWPQMLWMNLTPVYGLMEAQIFSQWLHLFVGWGGCGLLILRLFRGTVAERNFPLLALGGIFIAGLQWTAPLAKNDVGIAFWVLGSCVFLREGWRREEAGKMLLSGIFAGLALAGKVTAILSIGPIFLAILLALRPWRQISLSMKLGACMVVGGLAGAVPFYARNFLLTGNPFYPLFANIFPSQWMSLSWQAHFSKVVPSSSLHSLARIVTRVPELLRESPWIVGLLALVLVILWKRRLPPGGAARDALVLLGGAGLAYLLFVSTQEAEIELRYLGASLMILGAGGVWSLLALGERFGPPKMQEVWPWVLLASLLLGSKLPLHVLRKIWTAPMGAAYVQRHTAGEAKAWLREHREDGFVVVVGENEGYYLSPVSSTVLTERPDLDAATREEKDLSRFIASICRLAHARYLLDSRPNEGGVHTRFGAAALAPALVFSGQGAQIYDLRKLEAQHAPGSADCR